MVDAHGFRLNVGIILSNPSKQLFWGRRLGKKDAWQFPQGGIEGGETPAEALLRELQTEPFQEQGSGVLESYLIRIRRDGVAKNAQMKQRLDLMAENNTAIVTLIKLIEPTAKTPAFRYEADKFRDYASAWRDRWNSVMEVFMAGGNYAVSGVPFPGGFPAAVQAEIAATK